MKATVLTGGDLLDRLGSGLDDLHEATATPVTARRPWLSSWVQSHVDFEPLAIVVQNGGETLEGVALLGRRQNHGLDEFVALGHGPSDQTRLPARTPQAEELLATAVIEHLTAVRGRWRLLFRHLPCGDPVALRIADGLREAALVEGTSAPVLRFGQDRSLRSYVSQNHHQQVKRMLNRMRKDGLTPMIEHLRDPAAIRAVLPEIERICRERDLQLRGRSILDRPAMGEFFPQVIAVHAARGEVELTTVRLSGELAAYVLCFLDRGVYRMWNCRLAPKWVRYGVGRVGNDAALRCALEDPACREFDWMNGEEQYKFSMSNLLKRSEDLLAWSSGGVKAVFDMRRRLRARAKRAAAQHEWLQAALVVTRQLQSAGRRGLSACRSSRSRPAARSELQVESTDKPERLLEEWEHLAERLQASPFQRPAWFEAWWKAFGKGRPRILAVRDRTGGRLAAVLPLDKHWGALSSPTNWHSPEFGILADRPEALQLLITSAFERRPRRLSLAFLDDAQADRVEAAASAAGYRVIRRVQMESPFVSIDGNWDAYVDSLTPKRRSDLRRRQRQIEKLGELEFDVTCAERLDEQLEEGFRIEASGWKGAGGTAIISRPETKRFYTEVARWAAQRGWLRLVFMRVDGKPVAFNLCLEQGGAHYLLKSGYDETHADIAPGKVLRFEMVGRAYCLGFSSYEFLGAAESSKLDWTSTTRRRWLVQAFRGSPLGALDWSAFAYGRPLAKRMRNAAREAVGAGTQRAS